MERLDALNQWAQDLRLEFRLIEAFAPNVPIETTSVALPPCFVRVIRHIYDRATELGHYLEEDLPYLLYNFFYGPNLDDEQRADLMRQVEVIHPPWVAATRLIKEVTDSGDLDRIGRLVYGGGIMTIEPIIDFEPIPVMWTVDLVRSRCIAQDLQAGVNIMTTQPNKCAGYFLTFGHLVDNQFLNYIVRAKPEAFRVIAESEFLAEYGRDNVQIGPTPVSENFLWACQLVFLGILGKSAEAAGISGTFNKRLKTMFAMLGRFEPPP